MPYEILIRGDETGAFKGAHVIDKPGDSARAVKPEDWPAIASAINVAAVARVAELELASSTAELAKTLAETKHAELIALANSEDLAAIKAKVEEQKLSDRDRRRRELQKELDELDKPEVVASKPSL